MVPPSVTAPASIFGIGAAGIGLLPAQTGPTSREFEQTVTGEGDNNVPRTAAQIAAERHILGRDVNDRSTIDGGTLAAGKLRRLAEQDAAARRLDVQPAAAADMPGDANRSVGSVELHGTLTAHIAGENDLFCLQTRGVELAGFLHAVDLECLHLAAQTDRHVADDRTITIVRPC